MSTTLTHFRNIEPSLGHPNVDRAAGIIRNVSIISEGEARGHGVQVDDVTLKQVQQCASRFGVGGVGVKFNPNTFDHGPGGFAGSLRNLRITGTQLIGDLHVLSNFPNRDYLLELAASQPQSFGLSIDFDLYGEDRGGVTFARCAKLDAVTVVDVPAANACGLFRVGSFPSSSLFSKPNQPTMSTAAKPVSTSATFAARINDDMRQGHSRAAAILRGARVDPAGFNRWCAVGRPATTIASAVPTDATGFAAKISDKGRLGVSRAAAIQILAQTDPAGFRAWNEAGRPNTPGNEASEETWAKKGSSYSFRHFRFKGV